MYLYHTQDEQWLPPVCIKATSCVLPFRHDEQWLVSSSDHRVVMILQVPREALEFAGMSINFRSGKFGYSICPIFSKGHAKIFREF